MWLYPTPCRAAGKVLFAVGSNAGLTDEDRLTYGTKDALDVADVMVSLGGVLVKNRHVLLNPTKSEFESALTAVLASLDSRDVLVFYFSGHGSEQALHLSEEAIDRRALRQQLQASEARLSIAIIDACRGAKERSVFIAEEFKLEDPRTYSGTIELQSTSRGESAFESRLLQGGRFTRHLLSGLRGAADADRNGVVNLDEAYLYAYNHTLADSAATQNPTRNFAKLGGSGFINMTTVAAVGATVVLAPGRRARHTFYRKDNGNGTVFTEAWSHPAHATTIAIPEGDYLVWKTVGARRGVSVAEFEIEKSHTVLLQNASFRSVRVNHGAGGLLRGGGGRALTHDPRVVKKYLARNAPHRVEVYVGYEIVPGVGGTNGQGLKGGGYYSWQPTRASFSPIVGVSLTQGKFSWNTHTVERNILEGIVGVRSPALQVGPVDLVGQVGVTSGLTFEDKRAGENNSVVSLRTGVFGAIGQLRGETQLTTRTYLTTTFGAIWRARSERSAATSSSRTRLAGQSSFVAMTGLSLRL